METTIWAFSLSVPFATWAAVYATKGMARMHKSVGIKSGLRGISKDDSSKTCGIQQALVSVTQKIFENSKKMIRSSGHIIESTIIRAYSQLPHQSIRDNQQRQY